MNIPSRAIALFAMLVCVFSVGVFAQDYPTKPITLIVPFPEKGGGDLFAKPVAEKLAAGLGQPINVQNVPGKSGSVGVGQAAKASPDGYTLVFSGDAALTTNIVIFDSLDYDPRKDFAPIAQLVATQNAFIVPASAPQKSIADLVQAAKQKPGQSFAHAGIGFSSHVAGELLKKQAGIDIKPVQISAAAELFKAVEEGQVLFGVIGAGATAPRLKDGKIKAIAVTGPQRSSLLPDVPTLTEAGFAGHDASAWFALLAPKGTPEAIVAKLHAEATRIINAPDMVQRLAALGGRPNPSTPAELGKRIDTTIATLSDLLKDVPKQK